MKDLFEHIKTNKGNIGRWASHAEGYYVFPKLEGELGPHMKFQGKEIRNTPLRVPTSVLYYLYLHKYAQIDLSSFSFYILI